MTLFGHCSWPVGKCIDPAGMIYFFAVVMPLNIVRSRLEEKALLQKFGSKMTLIIEVIVRALTKRKKHIANKPGFNLFMQY